MNELLIKIISLLIILKSVNCAQELNQQKTTTDSALTTDRSERILSRRRRYLTFPEGSSLQLSKIIYFLPFLLIIKIYLKFISLKYFHFSL